jgi:hypothetical protein
MAALAPARAADEPLKVCLDQDLPPLSAHHKGMPDSGFDVALAASGYYYPIGVNHGYVGLAGETGLLAAVNKSLADLQAAGILIELGRKAGLTYLAPREPAILGDAMQKVLLKP